MEAVTNWLRSKEEERGRKYGRMRGGADGDDSWIYWLMGIMGVGLVVLIVVSIYHVSRMGQLVEAVKGVGKGSGSVDVIGNPPPYNKVKVKAEYGTMSTTGNNYDSANSALKKTLGKSSNSNMDIE